MQADLFIPQSLKSLQSSKACKTFQWKIIATFSLHVVVGEFSHLLEKTSIDIFLFKQGMAFSE